MAGNEKLKGGGLNDALTRRMILIPFEQSIPESEQDVNLVSKIVEKELPGVLNWAIDGMMRLVSNNYKFTKSRTIEESMEEYRVETDQIYSYIKECFAQWEGASPDNPKMEKKIHGLNLMVDEEIKLPTKYIYQHYVEWAKEAGINAMQQRNFSSKLAEKLKTKIQTSRVREVHIEKKYGADGHNMTYPTQGVPLRCIVGFKITSDIKITVNGMPMGVMETVLQHRGE
jgi:phage/plasmid-associated DNA primase